MKGAVLRHLMMKNYAAYEQVLKTVTAKRDIWTTSQGEYILWWQKRECATLRVVVENGLCKVTSSLQDAVFEEFSGGFLSEPVVACKEADFSGEIWLTIDSTLQKKALLMELLKREGILNFKVAKEGEFLLSQKELGSLLESIDNKLHTRKRLFESDIAAVRQVIINVLAKRGVPLIRIWYHPRVNGTLVKAVFSPRHDVDRAITNVARIRKLEQKYGVMSTLYLRAFCPFYSDRDIKALVSAAWCTEIGLHGEFVRNSRRYGDEFAAARAEKEYLEQLVGRPIMGLCMHGGEQTNNVSENTLDAAEEAGFLYDTTRGVAYYLPDRTALNGRQRGIYRLQHAFGDRKVPPIRDYKREFYNKVMAKMDEVYKQNGVFVLTLHPEYFGLFSYLSRPRNSARLVRALFNMRRGAL